MGLGLGLGHERKGKSGVGGGGGRRRLKIAEKLDTATPLTISIAVITYDKKTSNSLG